MGNHDHYALEFPQKIFQPGHHLIVQMVGRLVHQKHITGIYQCSCQCHSFLLTTGEMVDFLFMIRDSQLIQHVSGFTLCTPVLLPFSLCHIIKDRRALRKLRHLRQVCDAQSVLCDDLSLIRFFQTCNDLQNGGFTGTVNTDDTDFISLMDSIGNIIQNYFFTKYFGNMFYV